MPRGSKKALGQIVPGLWIGRMAAVREIFSMQENSKQEEEWSVVSMISAESMIRQIRETLQDEQKQFKKKHGRKLVRHHEVWDLPDKSHAPFVSSRLADVLNIIRDSIDNSASTTDTQERPKRNCLVHCARGVSRSAAVCAAWLVSCQGHSLPKSMDLIRAVRDVNPNMGFLAGLKALEKCNGDVLQAENRLSKKSKKNMTDDAAIEGSSKEPVKPKQKEQAKAQPAANNHKTNKENNKKEVTPEKKNKSKTKTDRQTVDVQDTNNKVQPANNKKKGNQQREVSPARNKDSKRSTAKQKVYVQNANKNAQPASNDKRGNKQKEEVLQRKTKESKSSGPKHEVDSQNTNNIFQPVNTNKESEKGEFSQSDTKESKGISAIRSIDEARIEVDVDGETNLSEVLDREQEKKVPQYTDEVSC